ncbi:MAG: 16S rRNA (cytosine(1402)-N(4))-methyltransferase RsmH, partial [Gammaproteobacteria bacterium]|nr:16S rRNA (cytosine(1402)-N(4))-methyltransferase RsmH [Gammaproteobacteria bacterium]
TYGRGGHSAAILARLGPEGRLLALDKDPEAVADGEQRFHDDQRFAIKHAAYEDMRRFAEHFGGRPVLGVLLDLGVSSPQLDRADRGFSFAHDGPLDMRMNTDRGPTAAEWLARVDEAELTDVIRRYGEEPQARRVARAILTARQDAPITTTAQLAGIVAAALPKPKRGKTHPATRVFQAVRIAVNDELTALERGLAEAVEWLAAGGRLAVISFHSLEDRIVKRLIAREAKGDPVYAGLPEIPPEAQPRLKPLGRLIRPGAVELEQNPRARSGRLRIAIKLAGGAAV